MVKFLDTQGVSAELSQTIKNANQRLVIVSPYLQVSHHIQQLLADTSVPVSLVCRQEQLKESDRWIENLPSVKVYFHKDLHAKCYLNEEQAILTSMNLYQFSQENNLEMGLLVSRRDQEMPLYEDIRKEADRFIRISKVILEIAKPQPAPASKAHPAPKPASSKPAPTSGIPFAYSSGITRPVPQPAPSKPAPTSGIPKTGFCIRCKTTVPADPGKPYCTSCYRSWNRYKNDEYEEKYCHICGNENSSTMAKPLCLSCHRTYKDILVTDDIDDLPF